MDRSVDRSIRSTTTGMGLFRSIGRGRKDGRTDDAIAREKERERIRRREKEREGEERDCFRRLFDVNDENINKRPKHLQALSQV